MIPTKENITPRGNQYTDPTYNVLQLVEAAVKRIDDLREADNRRIDEIARLHVFYAEKLMTAESRRIDANRAIDIQASRTEIDKQAQQAMTLATQVANSASTLRELVASTAATVATQLTTLSQTLADRLRSLEEKQFESKGKSGVTSPLLMMIAGLAGGLIVWIIQKLA